MLKATDSDEFILRCSIIKARNLLAKDSVSGHFSPPTPVRFCAQLKRLCLSPQNGFSDPYVVVSNGRESHTSQVISKTLNPEWNFSCDLTLTPDVTRISIALWDKDQFKSDFLGQISFSVAELFKSGEQQLAIGFHEEGNEVGLCTSHVRIEPACFTKLAP